MIIMILLVHDTMIYEISTNSLFSKWGYEIRVFAEAAAPDWANSVSQALSTSRQPG